MATVRPVLWTHRKDKKGQCQMKLRFSDAGRDLYLPLKVKIHPRHWNPKAERVRGTHDLCDDYNDLIETRLLDAKREELRLIKAGEPVTAQALKDAIAGKKRTEDFFAFSRQLAKDQKARGQLAWEQKQEAVLKKLEEFSGSPLPFSKITPALLDRWTTWLMTVKKNKKSTVGSAMRVIRANWNHAAKHGLVHPSESPFHLYRAPQPEPTDKARLTAEEVEAIAKVDLPEGMSRVRDWFLFSMYAGGLRISDTLTLPREAVSRVEADGKVEYRLSFRASKTGKSNSRTLVPPALAILEPYLQREGKPDDFIFDAFDGYDTSTPEALHRALHSRKAYANRVLKEIAKRAEVTKSLSTHVARHTFSDLARRQGWGVYEISKALQHADLKRTQGYLASFDEEALDARMHQLFPE